MSVTDSPFAFASYARWRVFSSSVFLFALIVFFTVQHPATLVMGAILCVVYYFAGKIAKSINLLSLVLFIFFVIIAALPSLSLAHGVSPFFYLFSSISIGAAAYRFSQLPYVDLLKSITCVFWVCIGLILFLWWVNRASLEPLGEVIPGSSTNGIPSYLIVLQVALSITFLLQKGRLPLISPFFTLLVAFLGLGRGSIIVALAIFLSSIGFNVILYYGNSLLLRVLIVLSFTFVIILIFAGGFYYGSEYFLAYIESSKFASGVLDPYRGQILQEYIAKVDALGFLLGVDYSGTVIATKYDGNPHIAFIRTHSFYGFFGVFIAIVSPSFVFLSREDVRFKLAGFLLLSLLLVRALTEPILFPTLLDFFYFYCFFIFFKVDSCSQPRLQC